MRVLVGVAMRNIQACRLQSSDLGCRFSLDLHWIELPRQGAAHEVSHSIAQVCVTFG